MSIAGRWVFLYRFHLSHSRFFPMESKGAAGAMKGHSPEVKIVEVMHFYCLLHHKSNCSFTGVTRDTRVVSNSGIYQLVHKQKPTRTFASFFLLSLSLRLSLFFSHPHSHTIAFSRTIWWMSINQVKLIEVGGKLRVGQCLECNWWRVEGEENELGRNAHYKWVISAGVTLPSDFRWSSPQATHTELQRFL